MLLCKALYKSQSDRSWRGSRQGQAVNHAEIYWAISFMGKRDIFWLSLFKYISFLQSAICFNAVTLKVGREFLPTLFFGIHCYNSSLASNSFSTLDH